MILQDSGAAGNAAPKRQPKPINPHAFFKGVQVAVAKAVQCMVTWGTSDTPNDHTWAAVGVDFADWVTPKSTGRKPAYFSLAAFDHRNTNRFKNSGRTGDNCIAVQGFCIDVDGGPVKWAKALAKGKSTAGIYETAEEMTAATAKFINGSGLWPTHVVETGSGGLHLYFILDVPISPKVWQGRADALALLAKTHGLKIDAPCTTDVARIFRAPGSIHQDTGVTVVAKSRGDRPFTLEEFDKLVGYVPGDEPMQVDEVGPVPEWAKSTGINGNVIGERTKYSYVQAAAKCGAMQQAAQRNGRDTAYPVWFIAAKAADLSVEGRKFAHEISCGHPDYEEVATDKKIDSLTGGPANCETWAAAYGAGGPCDTCEWRGKIKNPAVQLGASVDTTPPGVGGDIQDVAQGAVTAVGPWVAEMNQRYGLVRTGSKIMVADFQTYSAGGVGVGWLDVAAFRLTFNGRYAPVEKDGDTAKPLAKAWLEHTERRQYEGLAYAPGERLPANILNLWQGFAVEPVAGDVSLWLELLTALIPGEADRRYVLNWLAWKIQNPGGVPDTILIFKGAKGTGKNSLFDPLLAMFGRHAMLADDPELIAGTFSWHLMYLSFAVLDEAVFVGDPRQADRIKSRVTAKTMMYHQKGMDPVQGVNRCAYVMLTNHEHVWQATTDERRAVVIEVGEALRGNLEFWARYHAWVNGTGPAALLHYLQSMDLTGFNPREIPKGEALRNQIEQTTLRLPAAAWWHQCLTEGSIRWRDGIGERTVRLDDDCETEIDRSALRLSYEQSGAARGRAVTDWAATARRLTSWVGNDGIRKTRVRNGAEREWRDVLPPLSVMRTAFTAATQVRVAE